MVRLARRQQSRARRLQHHPHARVDGPQLFHFLPRKNAGIGMRQQPRLFKHQLAHRPQILDGGAETALLQPLAILRIAQLRLIAQTEQRFLTPGLFSRPRHGQHFIRIHGVRLGIARLAREGTVSATIPAKVRQRNKNLARIRDYRTSARVANRTRLPQEIQQCAARGANQPACIALRDSRFHLLRRHGQPISCVCWASIL